MGREFQPSGCVDHSVLIDPRIFFVVLDTQGYGEVHCFWIFSRKGRFEANMAV